MGVVDGRALRRVALILLAAFVLVAVLTLLTGTAAHAEVTPDDPGEGVTIDINGVDGGPLGFDPDLCWASRCSRSPRHFC